MNNYFAQKLQNMCFCQIKGFSRLWLVCHSSVYGLHPFVKLWILFRNPWRYLLMLKLYGSRYLCWVVPRRRHSASTFHLAFWTRDRTKLTLLEAQIFILWFSPFSTCMQEITPIMKLIKLLQIKVLIFHSYCSVSSVTTWTTLRSVNGRDRGKAWPWATALIITV